MNLSNFTINGDLVEDALANKQIQRQIFQAVKQNFNQQKKLLINEFTNHEISQEISNPELGNISNTLGGYGDLFGFIGFFAGSDPIGGAVSVLKNTVQFKNISISKKYNRDIKGRFTKGKITKQIKVIYTVPNLDDFDSTSQEVLRDEVTRNWIKGVERGISGFNRYANYPRGVSRRGVELNGIIKNPSVPRPAIAAYRPKPYLTPLISKFIENINYA